MSNAEPPNLKIFLGTEDTPTAPYKARAFDTGESVPTFYENLATALFVRKNFHRLWLNLSYFIL